MEAKQGCRKGRVMINKFTPGPWHVFERGRNELALSVGYSVQTKGNLLTTHYVCHVTDGHPNARANSVLIAAAPAMLEALEKADELIDLLIIDNTDSYVEERAQIRAAIKAAKGE